MKFLDELRYDAETALRRLRGDLRTSSIVVATLALGIGLNFAAFALLDALVLRPLPFRGWEALRAVGAGQVYPLAVVEGLSTQMRQISGIAGVSVLKPATVEMGVQRLRLPAVQVTGGFFSLLGAAPVAGRVLAESDMRVGAPPTAVITSVLARSLASSATAAIGRHVMVDGSERQVVGVIDGQQAYPATAMLWTPATHRADDVSAAWGDWRYTAIGTAPTALSDRVTTRELRDRLRQIRTGFPWFMPEAWGQTDVVRPFADVVVGSSRLVAVIVMAAVALVLSVAMLNVAQLLAGRQLSRQREAAIRAALGASPFRLARLAVIEAMLLTSGGLLCALVLGSLVTLAIPRWFGAALPPGTLLHVRPEAVFFACALAVVTGLLVSILPARMAVRTSLTDVLTNGGRGSSANGGQKRTARTLVITQLAFSGALITMALAAAVTVYDLRTTDAGFSSDGVMIGEVPLPAFASDSGPRGRAFFSRLPYLVAAVPGVRKAAVATVVPLDGQLSLGPIAVEANPTPEGSEPPTVSFSFVSDEYFSVLGMRVLRGRGLLPADMDTAAKVVVVNAAAAAKLWPGDSALGKRVRYVWRAGDYTVVGIVNDVRSDSVSGPAVPALYFPIALQDASAVQLLVRTSLGPDVAAPVRRAIETSTAGTTLGHMERLAALRERSTAKPAVIGSALALFGAVALLLGSIGMYAAADRLVRSRTREFGIRMAIGASPRVIKRSILVEGVRMALIGSATGCLLAVVAQRLVGELAFGGATTLPVALLGCVFAILVGITLVATWRPARFAAAIDPFVAMRAD